MKMKITLFSRLVVSRLSADRRRGGDASTLSKRGDGSVVQTPRARARAGAVYHSLVVMTPQPPALTRTRHLSNTRSLRHVWLGPSPLTLTTHSSSLARYGCHHHHIVTARLTRSFGARREVTADDREVVVEAFSPAMTSRDARAMW
jgi:hypothetical protein